MALIEEPIFNLILTFLLNQYFEYAKYTYFHTTVQGQLLWMSREVGGPIVKGELSEERVDEAMDVLDHMEKDFGVDDDEVVADSKEEEPVK